MAKNPYTVSDIGHGEKVYESPNPDVRAKFLQVPDAVIDDYAGRDKPGPGEYYHRKGGKVKPPKNPFAAGGASLPRSGSASHNNLFKRR
jgi:hypothetical protein